MPFNQIIVLFTKRYQNFSLLNTNSSLMLSLTKITITYQFDEYHSKNTSANPSSFKITNVPNEAEIH